MHHAISFILRVAYAAGFAFILLFHTADIINYIPQLLGGLLMLEAIAQILELSLLKVKTHVNRYFFAAPVLVLLYSLFLIFFCSSEITDTTTVREAFYPSHGFSWTSIELWVGGLCFLLFLISELAISIQFFKPLYIPRKFAEDKRIQDEVQKAKKEEEKKKELPNAETENKQETDSMGKGNYDKGNY